MRYTIGLDIGIASVGWAVINQEKSRIEDLGVRTFKKAEEEDGKSLNYVRREARGARRRIRRKATRMRKIKNLFLQYNLINEEELISLYEIKNTDKDVWQLRAEGLDKKLERREWARVLTTIAKRRGYKSNRKIDEEDKEVGKLTSGAKENKKILEEKSYRTIGEMFFKDEKFKVNKRNKCGEYSSTVLRSILEDEIHKLFIAQRNLKNSFASEKFEKEYIEIVMYQKPYITDELLEKMLGECRFEEGEKRAPKNSYTFERFMLLNKVNNLRIYINGEKQEIPQDKKNEIIQLAYKKAEIKYSQLRKILNLHEKSRFADLNYYNKKKKSELSQNEIIENVENKKFVKLEGWHKIRIELKNIGCQEKFEDIKKNPELQNIIADALVRNKTDNTIREYLRNKNIDENIIKAILKINFTKFGHLSYKAMQKIMPELEKGLTYDKACENAGYNFKGNNGVLQDKLPIIPQNEILNPVVLRSVSETRKVINAIIDKYGSPTTIYLETARDLSKSFEERMEISKKQKDNEKNNEEIKKYIKENFEFDAKPFDLLKMKLWREQEGKCIYSGKAIPAERLYEDNFVQVDHIIPFSRCFDDSYQNKVLVLTDENQRKQEKTPYEYFGENKERWHQFEKLVNHIYKFNIQKRANLLVKDFNDDKSKEWIARNLNDTKYIARFMYNYITNNLKFADSELKRKVYNINGQATAVLRRYWGLKKEREETDTHHALDAVVIACASNSNIKKITDYNKQKKLYKDTPLTLKEPWPRFREEVEARLEEADNTGKLYALVNGKFYNYDDIDVNEIKPILVSRKPERKISSRAHKDTMYSLKFVKQGLDFKTVRKPLTSITETDIKNIIKNEKFKELYLSDKSMYDDIYKKMEEAKFNASKAFANGYRKHSKKGEGPIVKSITIAYSGSTGVTLKNNSIAENDIMVRVDVFEKNNKFYLVPIYVADFVKKELPNKAIVASKKESEWIEMTDEYHFRFSLYKNDLVKVKRKHEKEEITYYKGTDRSSAGIILLQNPNNQGTGKTKKYGSQSLEIFEKYQVDILGNISKIKKEKREGIKKK